MAQIKFECACGKTHSHDAQFGRGPGVQSEDLTVPVKPWIPVAGDYVELPGGLQGSITGNPLPSKRDGLPRVPVRVNGYSQDTWYYVSDLKKM